jgi:predicted transcriptional regulator
MTSTNRIVFSIEVEGDILEALRQIAEIQGRELQAVLEEALCNYIDQHGRY